MSAFYRLAALSAVAASYQWHKRKAREAAFVSLSPPQAASGSLNTFGTFQDLSSKQWALQKQNHCHTLWQNTRKSQGLSSQKKKKLSHAGKSSVECFSAPVCFHQHYQLMCTACCWNVRVFMPGCLRNAPYGPAPPRKKHVVGSCSCG